MRKLLFSLCLLVWGLTVNSQNRLFLTEAKFQTGNEVIWSSPDFDDSSWKTIKTTTFYEHQGIDYDGYSWYRFHVVMPSAMKTNSRLKDSLAVYLGYIDDCDEVFFNGVQVGKTGIMPDNGANYQTAYFQERMYHLPLSKLRMNWDKDNILAIKVYDGGGDGGIGGAKPYIAMLDIINSISIDKSKSFTFSAASATKAVSVVNKNKIAVNGTLEVAVKDNRTGKSATTGKYLLHLPSGGTKTINVRNENKEGLSLTYIFTEKITGKRITEDDPMPYILTPKSPVTPRINGAEASGVRPGSPFLYKIAATGKKPLRYDASPLPEGLKLDHSTGIISGRIAQRGDYQIKLTVNNALGKAERMLTVKVGDLLALTPAMGWNSWNCWGLSVTADKVKSSAQALIDKGLIDHGWTYINIDDGWESASRNSDGTIGTNDKFPDMKGLGDWLHSHGLKFGIYSSPGTLTCGGFLGSLDHESQDAETYNSWGVDYLKHDWCSYGKVAGNDTSREAYVKPYRVMQKALRSQPRDIYYSLCQYGMGDVWKWGPDVDANSWRTTGDITDTWASLYDIGFRQYKLSAFAKPGRWNDPDMLIVGRVGWSGNLRNTRLTPDEQYTHITLWSLLSSPLLIGCDISQMDDFTLSLLTNDEVIAVNQDVLGRQAERVFANDDYQVYIKQLADGSKAIGVFNLTEVYKPIVLNWNSLNLGSVKQVRDLWRQKDLNEIKSHWSYTLAPHGTVMLKVR
ncbi:putative Ig domain-containing protein [Arcticibacter tournemirensis]|uniref:Alpha-galactosidase n=1 Tax=Arcticibacter tournemirensis TaxID=699437 RepID=A0A5M9H0X4_9SPHI|nr:putative Ig domain-containing protein [Arcticibacter tournemirensis]KAA8479715.1 alpha-galactosidase [Arcticibacter tournemirensis]TQM50257.1 putative Ig domain-containing protein [Arcticibacter tournemirensis]